MLPARNRRLTEGRTIDANGRVESNDMSAAATRRGSRRPPIIGRASELDVFRSSFDCMLAGRRQLVLVSGEPGIGKTRCAEALAEVAEDQGALVLWGRCHEEAGAPPYWPWVQILRAYVDSSSLDELRLNMGTATRDIAALVPELLDSTQHQHPVPIGLDDARSPRFRTFDAIRQFFHQATQQVPITLVLDNLHWADAPSLSLLEFLSQELPRSRLLIVATYRDADASRKTPLLSTLGGLCRDSEIQRVHLTGLSQNAIGEVAERLCGVSLSAATLRIIYQRTDGNPLFAIELIKVIIDESAGGAIATVPARIPAGVHETIGRRLSRLSDECNELLGVAAVLGRQFTVREVAATRDEEIQRVMAGLEPAVEAGIVQSNVESVGSYQFTHALIRETIYEDLPTVDRLRLHGRAGDALVGIYSVHLEPTLPRIAHHYHEASVLGGIDKAIEFAFRAADGAVRMCAYEEALLHYGHVIETLQRSDLTHDERLSRAYVLKGSALRQLGQVQPSIEALLEAMNRTRLSGSVEMLIDVLVSLAMSSRHLEQQHLVPLLDRALALLPVVDSAARAKALATLAFVHRALPDRSRADLVEQALVMAGRSCDTVVRCTCYQFAVMALRGRPENLQRRLGLGQEYIALAQSTGSADLLADAYHWQALNYFESGRLEDLEALLEHYGSLSAARYGLHQCQVGAHRITLALLRGEWLNLDSRIEELLKSGLKSLRDQADGVYGAQMFALNRELGRLQCLTPQVKAMAASGAGGIWEPGLMLICAEIGLLSEARCIFERLFAGNGRALQRDDMYLTRLVFCAEACCALADVARSQSLYQLLRPYARQAANHPTAVCFGAADLYLARLAWAADWPELARQHFDEAVTFNRAMRAWPFLARTLFWYGSFLATRRTDAERRLGRQHLRDADQLARRLTMTGLVASIESSLQERDPGVAYPDDLTAREVEVLRLLSLGRTNKDVSLVLAISLNTVATHVRNILNKTQCANRTEAAAYAIRHGLQCVPADTVAT